MTRQLPPPNVNQPMMTRMVTESLLDSGPKTEVVWAVSHPHPLISSMKIVRMFADDEGVEIYSASDDAKGIAMRNFVPMRMIRFTEEAMNFDVFSEELRLAEEGDDEPDEPEESETTPTALSNGQGSTASS